MAKGQEYTNAVSIVVLIVVSVRVYAGTISPPGGCPFSCNLGPAPCARLRMAIKRYCRGARLRRQGITVARMDSSTSMEAQETLVLDGAGSLRLEQDTLPSGFTSRGGGINSE